MPTRADCCTSEYTEGSTISVASVAAARPPITARPSGAVASAPSPKRQRHRHHAGDHRRAGHQHGRMRARAASMAAVERRAARAARLLGEGHQQDGVGHRDADRHDRAHERLHVQRRAGHGAASAPRRPAPPARSTPPRARAAATGSSRRAAGRSRRPRPPDPAVTFRERLAHRGDLAAHRDRRAARRLAGARDRLLDAARRAPEVLAGDVGRERHHALPVEAVVLADDRRVARCARRRRAAVGDRARRVTGTTRRSSRVVIRGCGTCTCTWNAMPRARVGPVVRRDEAAGRGGGGERAADLVDGDAELTGQLADRRRPGSPGSRAPGRTAGRAAPGSCASSSRTLAAKARLAAKSGPVTATSTGVGAPKFMMRLTMSPGSNENCASGKRSAKRAPQRLLKCLERTGASGLSATCSTPSCDPPVHRKMVLIGYDDGCTPT